MASSIEVKRENMNNVYRTIYQHDKISKQEIANVLALSSPTVAQIVTELLDRGLVYENGYFKSTGGRKAKGISCKMDARTAIGIDITKNHMCAVLVDLSGKIISSIRIRIPYVGNQNYYEQIQKLIERVLAEGEMDPETLLGVGVSVPGIVVDNQQITYAPLLKEHNLYEDLKDYIPYPYVILNDANAGGFGEAWYSSHSGNMVYLSLSNTVGGAVIMDNEIYYGSQCLGGEIGHMTLVVDGKPCYCGKEGCVDAYCSAQVLSDLTDGDLKRFFDLLDEGDERCMEEWKNYLKYLSVVINNVRNFLDCEVIIGGYTGSYMEKYMDDLRALVAKRSTFETDGSFVKSCALKYESSAVGAALYYIDQFIKKI